MNAVVQAEDYQKVRDWWIDALELELMGEWTGTYHYAELGRDGKHVVGIASAQEMNVSPSTPRTNAVVPQLSVADVAGLLERVKAKGGEVPFGPSFEQDGGFWYGAFLDIEGNQVWVVSLPAQRA